MAVQPFAPGPGQYIQNTTFNPAMQQMIVPAQKTSIFGEILSLAAPIAQTVGTVKNMYNQQKENRRRAQEESDKKLLKEANRQFVSFQKQVISYTGEDQLSETQQVSAIAKEAQRISESLPKGSEAQASFDELSLKWEMTNRDLLEKEAKELYKQKSEIFAEQYKSAQEYWLLEVRHGNVDPNAVLKAIEEAHVIDPNGSKKYLKDDYGFMDQVRTAMNTRQNSLRSDSEQARNEYNGIVKSLISNMSQDVSGDLDRIESGITNNIPVQLNFGEDAVENPSPEDVVNSVRNRFVDLFLANNVPIDDNGLPLDPTLRIAVESELIKVQNRTNKFNEQRIIQQQTTQASMSLKNAFTSGDSRSVVEALETYINSSVGRTDFNKNFSNLNDNIKQSLNTLRDRITSGQISPKQFSDMSTAVIAWSKERGIVLDIGDEYKETVDSSQAGAIDLVRNAVTRDYNSNGTVLTEKAYWSLRDESGRTNLFKSTLQHLFETGQISEDEMLLSMMEGDFNILQQNAGTEYMSEYYRKLQDFVDSNIEDSTPDSPTNFKHTLDMLGTPDSRRRLSSSLGYDPTTVEELWSNNDPSRDTARITLASNAAYQVAVTMKGFNPGPKLVETIIAGLRSSNRLERASAIMSIQGMGGLSHPAFQDYMSSKMDDDTGLQLLITAAAIPNVTGQVVDFSNASVTSGDWYSALDSIASATAPNFDPKSLGKNALPVSDIFDIPKDVPMNSANFQSISEIWNMFMVRNGGNKLLANNSTKQWLASAGLEIVYNKSDKNVVLMPNPSGDVVPHSKFAFNGRNFETQDQFLKAMLTSTINPTEFNSYNTFFGLDDAQQVKSQNPEQIWEFVSTTIKDQFGSQMSTEIDDYEFAILYDSDSEYVRPFRDNLQDLPVNYGVQQRFGNGGGILVAKLKSSEDWVRLTQPDGSPLRVGQHSAYFQYTQPVQKQEKDRYPIGMK